MRDLPGAIPLQAAPIVVGGRVLVPLAPDDTWREKGVASVSLATGEMDFAPTDAIPQSIASDGRRVYAATHRGIESWEIDAAGRLVPAQRVLHPTPFQAMDFALCPPPVVHGDELFVACTQFGAQARQPVAGRTPSAGTTQVVAYALALPDLTPTWMWALDAVSEGANLAGHPLDVPSQEHVPVTPSTPFRVAEAASLVGDVLVVTSTEVRAFSWVSASLEYAYRADFGARPEVVSHWGVRADTGRLLWSLNSTRVGDDPLGFLVIEDEDALRPDVTLPGPATGVPGFAYLKTDALELVVTETGAVERRWTLGEADAAPPRLGISLALADDALYATSLQSLYRIGRGSNEVEWRERVLESGQIWSAAGLVTMNGTLLGLAYDVRFFDSEVVGSEVYALGPDGKVAWRQRLPSREASVAAGDGVLVVLGYDGNLTVLGRTGASIAPAVVAGTQYPAPGAAAVVDLGGTLPGAQGNVSQFRAEWGDGAVTGWTNESELRHVYAAAGNFTARFYARNDAGQQGWTETTFFVGGTPPPPPADPSAEDATAADPDALRRAGMPAGAHEPQSLLAAPFAPENAEITFFVLGLLVTALGALVGLLSLKRKRDRLKEELRQLAEEFEETRQDAPTCEAMLARRRARGRKLLMDGRLDESQVVVLDRRIDEMVHALRLDVLDSRFDWLPHGTVKALRGMVQDGRLTAWEHEHALTLVETDPRLSDDQRAAVRQLVTGWFDADGRATTHR